MSRTEAVGRTPNPRLRGFDTPAACQIGVCMDNIVIGVMYTDYADVKDFIKMKQDTSEVIDIQGTMGQTRMLTERISWTNPITKKGDYVTYYYKFWKVDVNGPTHAGLCGMLFNGFHYLPGEYRCDFLNYCQSRVRHGEIM